MSNMRTVSLTNGLVSRHEPPAAPDDRDPNECGSNIDQRGDDTA